MSDILIKGMEIPKSCEDCFCYRHNAKYNYAYCNISSVNVPGHGNARLNNCPLVPAPPHGRLIDADWVRNDIDKKRPGRSYEDAWALTIIDAAPTIIPASEECDT